MSESGILFAVIITIGLIYAFVSEFAKAKKIDGKINNHGSPIEVDIVTIVTKRILATGRPTRTRYFTTIEFEGSKKRIEFEVSGKVYGMLAETDKGYLDFQGDKFIRFDRIVENADNVTENL